jgi:nitroreductase
MDLYKLLWQRESVRNYDPDRSIAREVLKRILEAGRIAPSAANRQPWHFIVVTSPEMLAKVRACCNRPWFQDAPHILIAVGHKDEAWIRSSDGYCAIETDLTITMDHMILAATYEGVGTCWIAAFENESLRKALALKEHEVVFAMTPLGYPRPGYVSPEK